MAVIVAARYPELFHAVCVHSGLPIGSASDLPSALQAMQQGAKAGYDGSNPHDRLDASPQVRPLLAREAATATR